MLKSVKENDFDAFKRISSDIGWVEISAEKMEQFESEMKGAEKKEFRREFAMQRIITVSKYLNTP